MRYFFHTLKRYFPIILFVGLTFALAVIVFISTASVVPSTLQQPSSTTTGPQTVVLEVQQQPPTSPWRDVFLVAATGFSTLIAGYTAGLQRDKADINKEVREYRKSLTRNYRMYISELLSLAQKTEVMLALGDQPKKEDREAIQQKLRLLVDQMPPLSEFMPIQDKVVREGVRKLIISIIQYIREPTPEKKYDVDILQQKVLKVLWGYEEG